MKTGDLVLWHSRFIASNPGPPVWIAVVVYVDSTWGYDIKLLRLYSKDLSSMYAEFDRVNALPSKEFNLLHDVDPLLEAQLLLELS